jgi:hypothetical protein
MAKKTATKKVSKTSERRKLKPTRARRIPPQFQDNAKITVLEAGKENPRRKGSGPYQRYEVLLKSRTVGAFLQKYPKWRSTIYRALRESPPRIKLG